MLDGVGSRHDRLGAGAGPLVGLSLSVSPAIWRIGPAWAVLAGALASGLPLTADALPLKLVGAVALADSAWGVPWRLTTWGGDGRSRPVTDAGRLPYYRDESPLGHALAFLHEMVSGATWHELTVALVLTVFLSLLLGIPALLLSGMAWAAIVWAWLLTQRGKRPAACDALLNVGLPWALGLALAEGSRPGSVEHAILPLAGLLPGIAFTLLQWGARRAYLSQGRSTIGVWLGFAAVSAVLIGQQQIVYLAVAAVLLLPSAWWLRRNRVMDAPPDFALGMAGPWWLAVMLLCASAPR